LEGGFLSNPTEARRIADPNYRELLARGVANALWPAKPAIAQSSRLPDKTSAMTPALPPQPAPETPATSPNVMSSPR
ncbi:MAG TPA: hypothetical protein P5055_17185, partial [Candidatus Paceibacterota bacterium]|nr:hypothetical protein [Candidatus Paceibacterota bacterium]